MDPMCTKQNKVLTMSLKLINLLFITSIIFQKFLLQNFAFHSLSGASLNYMCDSLYSFQEKENFFLEVTK